MSSVAFGMKDMKCSVWIFLHFSTGLVYAQVDLLKPVASKSSRSHIIAIKGSSVWLHWNYTYVGDGKHGSVISNYKEQVIGFNRPFEASKALARRIGENGVLTLESPVPAPFNGRVEVIPSNSTLVIHDLKYTDAFYQFSSTATVDVNMRAGLHPNTFHMLPNVSITLHGTPSFAKEPPRVMDVNENSNLLLEIYMAGNPKPTLYIKWSHRHLEWSRIASSDQLLRFLYVAKYKLSNIDGSYCGRRLQIKLKNSIGVVKTSTTVNIRLKLDQSFILKGRKVAASKCVEVEWQKPNFGECNVKYTVTLKGVSGETFYNETKENIGNRKICHLPDYALITDVQLAVSFKGTSTFATAKVLEEPLATSDPTINDDEIVSNSKGINIVNIVAVMMISMSLILVLTIGLIFEVRRRNRKKKLWPPAVPRGSNIEVNPSDEDNTLPYHTDICVTKVNDEVEPSAYMVCPSSEESSGDNKGDDNDSESSTIRSEVRLISDKGATMQFYVTGVKLIVPSGTFSTDTLVKLSTLDLSTGPEFQTGIGEVAIGNIIKVGPTKLKFNVPAILSIPYSIVDIPKHSSICIKYFDESTQKWLHCPIIQGGDEERKCNGYVDRPGLYVLCLLLNIDTHVISKSAAEIWPFEMQPGVEVVFDENTFQDDQTTVDFKINTFTKRMCEEFESDGMKPISILHVNVRSNCQPLKPVKISFLIPVELFNRKDVLILQSDIGDEFTDVTKQVLAGWLQHRVLLRVEHFSLFALVIKLMQVVNINRVRILCRNIYEVHVCVYENRKNGWSLRIGCCQADRREEMEHEMRIIMYNFVAFFTTYMHHGAMLTIDFNGFCTLDDDARVLVFNENAISSTKQLEMHSIVPPGCTVEVSFLVDGAGTPIVLPLKANEASACGSSQALPRSEDDLQRNGDNQRNTGDIQEEEEVSFVASEEPTLSDMKDDHNAVNDVDEKLRCSAFGSIKDLSLRFNLSYKERCLVMNSALPSRRFVTDLFQTRKDLSLKDLKNDLEITCNPPNKMIFKKIEKDIKNGSVSVSLSSTLGELALDSTIMLDIADKLVPEEGTLLPTWKDIGGCHGYTVTQLGTFTESTQNVKGEKTTRLLSLLSRDEQSLPISNFVRKVKEMKRSDVAMVIDKWCQMKMGCEDVTDCSDEELTLSKLQECYNLRKELGRILEYNDIRKLCSKFQLSNDQSKYIMTNVRPCHAFLESLSVSRPDLPLRSLRDTIEEKCTHPNKVIFTEIEKDINSESISYTLDTELGALIDNPEHWLHILTTLAHNLLHKAPAQLQPSWQNVASFHGYKARQIKALEDNNQGTESLTDRFLSVLCAHIPSLPLSDFAEKLENIGRIDASNVVKQWTHQAMLAQSED